jgi:hypothetical protein
MKQQVISVFLFIIVSGYAFAQQSEIDLLTNRLIEKSLNEFPDYNSLEKDILNMNSDGSWNDIDYDIVSSNYPAEIHLNRLINMTIVYRRQGSAYSGSGKLLDKIISGVDFFFNKNPKSTNWWYNDIGAPQKYMIILILLKGKIPSEQLQHYASFLEDKTGNPGHKGKNRTWISAITIYKGCIEDNFDLIETGFNSIASTIKIVDYHEIEGIKIDNSIHQHRPQLYSGGYGMSFIGDLAEYIRLAHGTVFSNLFTTEKMGIIRNTMLGGQLLFGYREVFDFGAVGRNISRENGIKNGSTETLELIKTLDDSNVELYEKWINHIEGGPFPQPGNKYFWKSDIMTHHGENYYLSAKVISTRTNGTEMLNGENKEGYYLPLGATNIMTTGKEYENIFPVWDWTRIPGTTSVSTSSTSKLNWYHFGSNKYAGGVSNGKNGCIAFEHIYNGVQAKKAYFFIDDAMLCLGSGITAYRTNTIATTVNQCYTEGDIYFNNGEKTEKFSTQTGTFNKLNWVHHNKVGYIFPDNAKIVLQAKEQTGSWNLINDTGNKDEISHKIFTLWFDHGREPQNDTYCYIIMPDKNLSDFEKNADKHGFVIIKNEPEIQAVKNGNTYAVIFYKPASVWLENDLQLSTDKEAIVLIEKQYKISVADPLYETNEINLTINRKLSGDGVKYKKNQSVIQFTLPQGEYTGSTVSKSIK